MTLLDRTPTVSRDAPARPHQPLPLAPLGGSYVSRGATTADGEGTYVTAGSSLSPSGRGTYVTTASPSRFSNPGRYTYSNWSAR
ncbi:hypothetical protein IWX65_001477 [Arthrobacter sp. CAN_A214]|uniref:hypothetical protein n=1 Tax=Arthrobacter sp. CAN_A214 TaxID=2787720 RepID=UPI0018CB4C61